MVRLTEPTSTVVTYQGDSKNAEKGLITQGAIIRPMAVPPPPPNLYLNGDANDDGKHDIADAVTIVNHLIGPPTGQVECMAAMDADGQNGANIADAIYLINWLFRGGPPPTAPWPDCGRNTREDCPPGSVNACAQA